MRVVLRCALLVAITVAAYAASTYTDLAVTPAVPAEAQVVPAITSTATATATGTFAPAATFVPTPTSTPTAPPSPTDTATSTGTATAVSSPTATATAIASATPMPPSVDLPPLSDVPDDSGVVATAIIDVTGGNLSSKDGRVDIEFPKDAVPEALSVTITRKGNQDVPWPSPDNPAVAVWDFGATSNVTSDAVHTFARPLTVTLRFSVADMAGLDPRNLMLWTLDDSTGVWSPVPARVDARSRTLVALTDHFTVYEATASNLVDTAPLLDAKNVDLHSGAAAFSIPIEVPPGRGGLQPQLSLSYSSARVGEMRTYAAGSSWAGIGWDLDVPNIQFQFEPGQSSSTEQVHRAFLSLGGVGGEIMQPTGAPLDPDGSGYIWYLRDSPNVKIRAACEYAGNCPGPWMVWDQNGTEYVLGDSTYNSNFVRFYRELQLDPPYYTYIRSYRMDVQYIEDVHGNRIDFTYWQQRYLDPQGDHQFDEYVMAAYPETITYNGGLARIEFVRGHDDDAANQSPHVDMRDDTPRDVANCRWNEFTQQYDLPLYAPEVLETQRLDRINVEVSDAPVRSYSFNYQTGSYIEACTPSKDTGTHRLISVQKLDRTGVGYPYTTTSFQYTNKHHAYLRDNDTEQNAYDWPHLTRVDNAFGGVVLFEYEELGRVDTGFHWSRSVVTKETHQSGASQPDVYTTINYGPGPDQQNYPNPYKPTDEDTFNAEYRGFNLVTEIDSAGNQVKHYYYTYTSGAEFGPDDIRTGREYDTVVEDAQGSQWQRTQTTWAIRSVSNLKSGSDYFVNFVDPSQVVTTLKDGTALTVANTYDDGANCLALTLPTTCYGLLTQVDDQGESGSGERVLTKSAYHKNTAQWLFPAKYVEKLDADNGNALISCDRNYYDDANNANTLPTQGLITAHSKAIVATPAQCDGATAFTSSTNTYSSYDAWGNVVRTSVATSTAPESQSAPTAIGPIQVVVRAVRVGANDDNNVRVFIRSRGVDAESGVKILTMNWGDVSETWPNDPATGLPWTPAGVAALEAGFRNAMGPTGGGGVAVTQVYVQTADGQTLRPIDNGSYLEWGEPLGSGTTHWDRVAETTPDEFGSYVMDNTHNGTERDTFELSDPNPGVTGRIPAGVDFSETAYDGTYHVFPISQTNPLNQPTTIEYDYVLGKPTLVTEPNGHTKTIVYDDLGRVDHWYDDLDSDLIPTVEYTYTWGAVPNTTLTQTRTVDGDATALSSSLACLDGFGREFEHRQTYDGANLNSVRTDYDARGNKLAVSNAIDAGTSMTCTATPTDITTLNRTLYTYDPLGNANLTMSINANDTAGPYSQSIHNGKTTTLVDERGNRTDQVTGIAGRTLTTTTGTTSTILRPSAQGDYSQWASATPDQAHYLNVREVLADDGASQFSDQTTGAKDTQAYPGAGLPPDATVLSVSFKFRWKGAPMWAIFRQSSVDTRSPSQFQGGTGGTVWRDDQWDMSVNPATGLAWTAAELNVGTQFGFEKSDGVTYITQAFVEIITQTTPDASTVYHYDGAGNLLDVTDAASNHTTVSYDLTGRKLSMTDPDMGSWSYQYNPAGSLTSQTDARGIITTLDYDVLQRLKVKTYSNGDAPVSFQYDTYPTDPPNWCSGQSAATAVGQMTVMSDASGQQLGCFDTRGRSIKSQRTVNGQPYEMSTTYPTLSQPNKTVTYPDGDVVSYSATTQGNITGMSSDVDGPGGLYAQTLLSDAALKPSGAVESLPLGNSFTTSYSYDSRQRLTNISTGFSSVTYQNFTLTYDDAGNVTSTRDDTVIPSETVDYGYDGLNRLTTMEIGGIPRASYTYDSIGNLLIKSENGTALALCYGAKPHAATKFYDTAGSDTCATEPVLTYTADGSMISGADQGSQRGGQWFDAENRLTAVLDSKAMTGGVHGFRCVDLNGDGVVSAAEAQFIYSAFQVTMTPTSSGYNFLWDVNQDGGLGAPDAMRENGGGGPCLQQLDTYRYDGNGTLLQRTTLGAGSDLIIASIAGDSLAEWNAEPAGAHWTTLSDGLDGTYVEQSQPSKTDIYTFSSPSPAVPPGAVITSVTLRFRWQAVNTTGTQAPATLIPVFRQNGTVAAGKAKTLVPGAWKDAWWSTSYNPVTGRYWTVDDLSSLEFGFQTSPSANPAVDNTPRVSNVAGVFISYRMPAETTTYIGGVYEKKSDGSVTKYYGALGKTIAVRQVPAGGGQGALYYPLSDHLGSTVDLLDENGYQVQGAKTTYWPYGATRSGGVTQTDKMYTGQQIENGDSALGLYNYKARFYSTTLGRFVSADPAASLNRYAYTANNPLRFIDPSGLTLMIACGTGNHCETGQDAGQYRNAIIAEWMREGRYPGASRAWLENLFDTYFLNAFLKIRGFNGLQSAQTFGVVFLDTGSLLWEVAKDHLPFSGPGDVGPFLNANYYFFGARGADYWIGFSQGGQVVFEALQRAWDHKLSMPKGAVLIEPSIGQASYLSPGILEATRVITWSDTGFSWIDAVGGVRGWIWGAYNFKTSDCGGLNQHCSHGKWQGVMMAMVYMGAGDLGDWMIPSFAKALNVTVQCHVSYSSHRMGVDGC